MIKGLLELSKQVSLEDTLRATILWTTINTNKPTMDEMKENGSYLKRCIDDCLHDGVTMEHWHMIEAADLWEMRNELQGLGGCEAKPLEINRHQNDSSNQREYKCASGAIVVISSKDVLTQCPECGSNLVQFSECKHENLNGNNVCHGCGEEK